MPLSDLVRAHCIRAFLEQEPIVDQLLPAMLWVEALGHEHRIVPVTPNNLGLAFWVQAGGATQQSSTTPDNPNVTALARAYAELLIHWLICDVYAGRQDIDVLQGQVDTKLRALQYLIGIALINGRGPGFNEPVGLRALVVASQIWGANDNNPNGGSPTMADFDRLVNLIRVRGGRGPHLVMNLEAFRKWKALYTSAGSIPPVRVDPETGQEWYYHGDARILVSGHIRNDESKGTGSGLTSVYAVVLDAQVGFFGLFKTACPGKFAVIEAITKEATDDLIIRIALNLAFIVTSKACVAQMDGVDPT